MFHQMGNSIKGYLVDELKSLDSNEGFKGFVQFHKGVLKEKSIESVLNFGSFWKPHLLSEYDIVYSNDSDERDDNSHPGLSASPEDSGVEAERPADSDYAPGPASGVPAGEQGGAAGHFSDLTTVRPNALDRSEDGQGSAPASADSLSGTIEKLRSHGPGG